MKLDTVRKIINLKPHLKLIVRHPVEDDAHYFVDFLDSLIAEDTYIASKPQTVEDEISYIKSMRKKMKEDKEIHLVVFDGNTKVAGVDLTSLGIRKEHTAELGIYILKAYRGKGLGEILIDEVLKQAQEVLKIKMIILTVFEGNDIAINLYKKKGFTQYGKLPRGIMYKGKYIDELLFYKNL